VCVSEFQYFTYLNGHSTAVAGVSRGGRTLSLPALPGGGGELFETRLPDEGPIRDRNVAIQLVFLHLLLIKYRV